MGVLFYDKSAKIQIRVRGTGRVETTGPVADEAWAKGTNFARRCYLGEGPVSVSEVPTSGLPPEFEGAEPDDEQLVTVKAKPRHTAHSPRYCFFIILCSLVGRIYSLSTTI